MLHHLVYFYFFLSWVYGSGKKLISYNDIFFVKHSNTFFTAKITNNIHPRDIAFDYFNHKNLFWPIRNYVTFSLQKNFYILIHGGFHILMIHSYMVTSLKFSLVLDFKSVDIILIVLRYVLLTMTSNLLIYIFFDTEVMYL